MDSQGGYQADDGVGNAGTDSRVGVVFGQVGVGVAIETARHAVNHSVIHQPPQRPGVEAQVGGLSAAEEGPPGKLFRLSGAL